MWSAVAKNKCSTTHVSALYTRNARLSTPQNRTSSKLMHKWTGAYGGVWIAKAGSVWNARAFGACIAVQRQLGPHCMEVDYQRAQRALELALPRQCLLYLIKGNFRICLIANFGVVPLGKDRLVYTPHGPALYGPHP